MKTLEELKADLNLLEGESFLIVNDIKELEEKELLPELKKKYEGKYFKYRNCYSCPEKEEDYWYVYSKVEEVKSAHGIQCKSFQTDKYGRIEIEDRDIHGEASFQIQITKKQFDRELKKIMKKLEGF